MKKLTTIFIMMLALLITSINTQAQTTANLTNFFFTTPNPQTSQFTAQIFTRNEDDPISYVSLFLKASSVERTEVIRLEDFGGGIFSKVYALPYLSTVETWHTDRIEILQKSGNLRIVTQSELTERGFATKFNVVTPPKTRKRVRMF